jgi:hypothetical protein
MPAAFFYNDNGSDVYTDNCLNLYLQPWTNITYNVTQGDVSQVPEPLTISVFGAGALGVAALRRRNKKKA